MQVRSVRHVGRARVLEVSIGCVGNVQVHGYTADRKGTGGEAERGMCRQMLHGRTIARRSRRALREFRSAERIQVANPGGGYRARRRLPRSAPTLQAANQGAGYRARRRRFRRNLLGSFKGLSGLLQSGPFRSEGLEYCSEPMGYGLVLRLTGLQVMPKRHVGNLQNRPAPIKLWVAREEYGWD